MTAKFTWTEIYHELAVRLLEWRNRQQELLEFLESLRSQGLTITPLLDRDADGQRFRLTVIDPFTFFGAFNRQISKDQRLGILTAMKEKFELESSLPSDFDGIPVLNNKKSWFIAFQLRRGADDVDKLWHVFKLALEEKPLDNPEFAEAFDNVTFAHVDLGVRLQLPDVRRPWVPYADLALTYWPVRDVVKQAGKGASWWP